MVAVSLKKAHAARAAEVGAPLLMATFFAFTIRPLAAAIFELRRQSTVRIASQAAAAAVLEERDARLASLDALARPLLQRNDAKSVLTNLLAEREPIYSQADLVVRSKDGPHTNTVNAILKALKTWKPQ